MAMTSHELAAKLLELPNVAIWIHASERSWPDDLEIEPDDITPLTTDGSEAYAIELWPSG